MLTPLFPHVLSGLQFIQFAFRWMNCLLMRELPLIHIVRLWDTYLAMEDGFSKVLTSTLCIVQCCYMSCPLAVSCLCVCRVSEPLG